MYSNIGKKIRNLAVVCAVIGMIASISIGSTLIKMSDGGYWMGRNETLLMVGIVVIILGSIVSWLLSFVLYGFGRLVENSDIIARQFRSKGSDDAYVREEPKQPMSQVIRNAMDKGAIAAKNIYDKSGNFIDSQAQKAQARRDNAVQQQRPAQQPVRQRQEYDVYSESSQQKAPQKPADNSFAMDYDFLDI